MNEKYILLILTFFLSVFFTSSTKAQCDLSILSIDYGQAILPDLLAGECKPENTLNIEVFYAEGMSDSLRVNGREFMATGSPQTIQFIGIPQVLFVELVGTGCYRLEDVSLYGLPTAPAMLEGDTVFCAGETIPPITVSGHANSTFHWTNKDGSCIQSLFFSGAYNEEWTYPHPGEFAVHQYIDGMVTAPLYINVREGLPVEIIGDTYFCEGTYSTLNVLANGQNVTSEYDIVWYTPIGVESDVLSVDADLAYLYIVEVTDNSGCVGSASVWIEESPTPDVMILEPAPFCEDYPIELTAVAHGSGCLQGCDYMWQSPEGETSNTQNIEVNVEGTYTITITGEYGCSITESIVIEENCDEVVSVENPTDAHAFSLYPNPSLGAFNIEFPNNQERQLTLFNLEGQAIYQVQSTKQLTEISVQHLSLPVGVYIMQVHEKGIIMTEKVMIMQQME